VWQLYCAAILVITSRFVHSNWYDCQVERRWYRRLEEVVLVIISGRQHIFPVMACRCKNCSMVMTLNSPCRLSMGKKSEKAKSVLMVPRLLASRYMRCSGGNTNVRFMAIAKATMVSMAMRMLFQPPPSGSKVK
jgi:hypothetical protein